MTMIVDATPGAVQQDCPDSPPAHDQPEPMGVCYATPIQRPYDPAKLSRIDGPLRVPRMVLLAYLSGDLGPGTIDEMRRAHMHWRQSEVRKDLLHNTEDRDNLYRIEQAYERLIGLGEHDPAAEHDGALLDDSPLMDHARTEMRVAGMFDPDADYVGEIGPAVMEVMRTLCTQGHSGGSAHMVGNILQRLWAYKPLRPLTGAEQEWAEVWERKEPDDRGAVRVRQNRRCGSVFQTTYADGRVETHDLDGGVKVHPDGFRSNYPIPVTFPYTPADKPQEFWCDADGNVLPEPAVPGGFNEAKIREEGRKQALEDFGKALFCTGWEGVMDALLSVDVHGSPLPHNDMQTVAKAFMAAKSEYARTPAPAGYDEAKQREDQERVRAYMPAIQVAPVPERSPWTDWKHAPERREAAAQAQEAVKTRDNPLWKLMTFEQAKQALIDSRERKRAIDPNWFQQGFNSESEHVICHLEYLGSPFGMLSSYSAFLRRIKTGQDGTRTYTQVSDELLDELRKHSPKWVLTTIGSAQEAAKRSDNGDTLLAGTEYPSTAQIGAAELLALRDTARKMIDSAR